MRHGKKINHLGRKTGHRKALMKNLSISLIEHKRINTTLAKAKALRKHIEPLVTTARKNTTHARRVVFSYLQSNDAVKELFGPIINKVGDRPGGYIRIIKTGFRKGDDAEMAMIEFVDFNEVLLSTPKSKGATAGKKKKRTRRGKKKDSAAAVVGANEVAETAVEEAQDTTATNEEE